MNKQLESLKESHANMAETIKQYTYYLIIFIVSLISVFFLPFLGSTVGLEWNIPNTTVGWVVYVTTKVTVAALNVLLFHSFMQQAKVNVQKEEKYIKANEILGRIKIKEYHPRSPKQFNMGEYGKKGTTIFITSALATVALSQALLSFDWVSMLTYIFTIIMGLIFGVMQMFKAEIYWTEEYYDYAKVKEEEFAKLSENKKEETTPSVEMKEVKEEIVVPSENITKEEIVNDNNKQ